MGGSTKQALLQALSAAEGAYISGQQLAEALGVSRAAVHKAAQALSAQGYTLDSAPRRGYRLAGGDPFCAEAVGPYPAPIHIYDTLQSSNLTAKQLALGGVPPYGYTAKPVTSKIPLLSGLFTDTLAWLRNNVTLFFAYFFSWSTTFASSSPIGLQANRAQ